MTDRDVTDTRISAAERRDLNLALGCACAIALVVLVGLTIYLWTL